MVSVRRGRSAPVRATSPPDIVLDGKIQSAMRPEKQKLWRNAVDAFTETPGLPYNLIFSDSTHPGGRPNVERA